MSCLKKWIFIFLFVGMRSEVFSYDVYDLDRFRSSIKSINKLMPFETDMCSLISEGPKEDPQRWKDCCIEHDYLYWIGGNQAARERADDLFFECLKPKASLPIAKAIYSAVRLGGGPHSTATYRWGYGWTQLRGYLPFTDDEKEQVEQQVSLVKNKSDHVREVAKQNLEAPHFITKNFCEEKVMSLLAEKTTYQKVILYKEQSVGELSYTLRISGQDCSYKMVMSYLVDEHYCSRYENLYLKEKIISRIIPLSRQCQNVSNE